MDLTKWIPLFEKCPELRPTDGDCLLVVFPDPQGQLGTLCKWLHCDGADLEDDGSIMYESPDVAAAMIRDRAVWWLNVGGDTEFVIHDARGNDIPGTITIFYGRNEQHVEANDPTEALYLACCKVLGVEP